MLSIESELNRIISVNVDKELEKSENLISDTYHTIIKNFNNSAKQQMKILNEVELFKKEFLEIADKDKKLIEDVLNSKYEVIRQSNVLLRGLMDMYDLIFNFCKVSLKIKDLKIESALETLLKEIRKKYTEMGITLIDKDNVLFDSDKHYVVATDIQNNKPKDFVIEILKVGMVFEGKTIKKAEVTVNKI